MPTSAKRRTEPDAALFSCVSNAQFLRQEFIRFNMLHRTHRATPEAELRTPELRTRPTRYVSQKRCVARRENLRRGFFRLSSLHRTHRATPKSRFLRRANRALLIGHRIALGKASVQ